METVHKSSDKTHFLREIWDYRYALHNLVLKDFRVRYRNMSLGILWSVLNPLVFLGVLIVVFSYIHENAHADHFPIFILLGLVNFGFFSMCISAASGCILGNVSLVKKVIFPRQIIPVSVVLSNTIHLLIQLLLLVLFILIFKVPWNVTFFWMIPVVAVVFIYILGLVFFLSAMSVYYQDVRYLVESSLRVMFWFTPIFYALPQVKLNLDKISPPLYYLYILNPLAGCIDTARRAILQGKGPDWEAFGVAIGVAVVTLVFGAWFFNKKKNNFTDKM